MSKECRGFCFEHYGPAIDDLGNRGFRKKPGSKCKCKLQKCPKCKNEMPQSLLDCCEGFCQECAMEVSSVFGMVEKKLNIREMEGKEYLQKFADLMAEFLNYQK
jgi:hypothetical protein